MWALPQSRTWLLHHSPSPNPERHLHHGCLSHNAYHHHYFSRERCEWDNGHLEGVVAQEDCDTDVASKLVRKTPGCHKGECGECPYSKAQSTVTSIFCRFLRAGGSVVAVSSQAARTAAKNSKKAAISWLSTFAIIQRLPRLQIIVTTVQRRAFLAF